MALFKRNLVFRYWKLRIYLLILFCQRGCLASSRLFWREWLASVQSILPLRRYSWSLWSGQLLLGIITTASSRHALYQDLAWALTRPLYYQALATCILFVGLIIEGVHPPKQLTASKVHQRGKRVAFLNLMSLGPINLAPVLSGYVADRYNWRANFWILTVFTGLGWCLIVFACPETRFSRPMIFETDLVANTAATISTSGEPDSALRTEIQKKSTYWQDLRPYSFIDRNSNPLEHLVRLFSCALYPAVIWCFLVGSTYSGWVGDGDDGILFLDHY